MLRLRIFIYLICLWIGLCHGQTAWYPDQFFVLAGADSLLQPAVTIDNLEATAEPTGIQLTEGALTGFVILRVQSATHFFDVGLPSWNGTAPGDQGGFRVMIRFPSGNGWSPWLEVGYWKSNLWPGAKVTRFEGGMIDIDTAILYSYVRTWQFKIEMQRKTAAVPSPTLSRLSFFVSDSRTTQNLNYNDILADKPAAIFIPTDFLAQYQVSATYGGRICSPTTVAMILRSYQIPVDPLKFALDTYDPYYEIFGVWPRVVQNASEYGLRGEVTRYRSWRETRQVLAAGGRIGMSIGAPLYSGHLVMLAGFTANGDPIVHDPARTRDGYAHLFSKAELSQAWFDKGGVAYTFYLRDSAAVSGIALNPEIISEAPPRVQLFTNYPNPFNAQTWISYELKQAGGVEIQIFNILGEKIFTLESRFRPAGRHTIAWDGTNLAQQPVPSGAYYYRLIYKNKDKITKKLIIIR
ncbi:C39 family peptidase [candidate division KSB1 bacterium]|nr:C39 family peptidase [candidate division KSB1 bacterium]